MKAHVVENGIVINTIEVASLDVMPGLIDGSSGGPGWLYDGSKVIDPNALSEADVLSRKEASIRAKRDSLLSRCDWMALSDNTLTPEWATYRQALRDITDHANFPWLDDADWPVKPG